jgi:hypothetical protein
VSISAVRPPLYLFRIAFNLGDISEYDSCNWIHVLGKQMLFFKYCWIEVAR